MITFFTGFPRTGKSYRAVWYIDKNFLTHDSKDFNKHQYCYTNIGGFKFDVVNNDLLAYPLDPAKSDFFIHNEQLVKENDDYTKETIYLDWNKFYPHIQKMHEMALADKPDVEILRYARYYKLTPALLVIDEAYRFYKKTSDPALVWLNGYHGHLGLDIIFIIHRPTLMASDYTVHTEEFVNAQSKSKQINNNTFTYMYYDVPHYSKFYHKEKLRADPAIFALYKSGDLHKPKKILYKFIGIALAAFGALFLFSYFFYYRMHSRLDSYESNSTEQSSALPSSRSVSSDSSDRSSLSTVHFSSDKLPLIVRCDADSCARVDSAFVTKYVPRSYFEELLKGTDYKLITVKQKRIFDIMYNDFLYLVPSSTLRLFPFWSIPLTYDNTPSSVSTSSPLQGVTQ